MTTFRIVVASLFLAVYLIVSFVICDVSGISRWSIFIPPMVALSIASIAVGYVIYSTNRRD